MIISSFVRLIHYIIVFFIFFGFLLPDKYIKYHLFFIVILKIHWITNNDKCILTQIEQHFDNNNNNNDDDTKYPFMNKLLDLINVHLTDKNYDCIFDKIILLLFIYDLYKYNYLRLDKKFNYKLIKNI